jgi:predicted HTH domain antitoxin
MVYYLKGAFMSDIYRLTIEIPRAIKSLMPDVDQEVKKFLAMKLYQNRSVSMGRAAEIAGINRIDFEFLLAENNISIPNQTYEEVIADAGRIARLRASS